MATALTPVAIGTHPDRKPWIDDCLASIAATSSPRRRILVHEHGGYEPAAIRAGCAKFDQFLFLHDSVTILHRDFWKIIDASGPAWLAGSPHMFLGIFTSDVEDLLPDHTFTKADAIHWENHLPALLTMPVLWPDIVDMTHLRMEERHGRLNKVLGNTLWEKHKGNWGQT